MNLSEMNGEQLQARLDELKAETAPDGADRAAGKSEQGGQTR